METKEEEKKTGNSIADKLKAFNPQINTKKEEPEKPKEEEKKARNNITEKLKNFNTPVSTKKEESEKPKEEDKKVISIADRLKSFDKKEEKPKG